MILDSISNYRHYAGISPLFSKAFNYLTQTDLNTLALGKHLIEGDDLFVIIMEYDSKPASECIMESHRKYIDIQYMISGEEMMGTSILDNHVPTVPYDEAKDVAFYKNEYSTYLKVSKGQFTVFFPHDVHMPCIQAGQISKVRKAVFKIRNVLS
jgi:YhcH/YjgK/YiaL family protein